MVSASCAMYTFSLKTCTSKERREKSFLQDHWSNDKGLPLAQNIDCLQNESWKKVQWMIAIEKKNIMAYG